jgi:WD40 repeat protein
MTYADQIVEASGRTVSVTASGDRAVRVWDATYGEQWRIFRHHAEMVGSAEYDPTGTRIVTASPDGTVRIFEDLPSDLLLDAARRRTFRRLTPEERTDFGLQAEPPS